MQRVLQVTSFNLTSTFAPSVSVPVLCYHVIHFIGFFFSFVSVWSLHPEILYFFVRVPVLRKQLNIQFRAEMVFTRPESLRWDLMTWNTAGRCNFRPDVNIEEQLRQVTTFLCGPLFFFSFLETTCNKNWRRGRR